MKNILYICLFVTYSAFSKEYKIAPKVDVSSLNRVGNEPSIVGAYFIYNMKQKICTKCGELKDLSQFYAKNTRSKDGKKSSCKKCDSEYHKNRRKGIYIPFPRKPVIPKYPFAGECGSKDYKRNNHLIIHYGISIKEYREMVSKQSGLCSICDTYCGDTLCVDHDHKTGKIRGLLCQKCNQGIGMFKDNIKLFDRAIKYLLDAELSSKIETPKLTDDSATTDDSSTIE